MKPQGGLFHSSGLHSALVIWRRKRTGALFHLREASAGLSSERVAWLHSGSPREAS